MPWPYITVGPPAPRRIPPRLCNDDLIADASLPSPTRTLLHFGSLVAGRGQLGCAHAMPAASGWCGWKISIRRAKCRWRGATPFYAALPAFGLIADEPVLFQSQRISAYDDAFEKLRAANRVFPCWCSRGDLAAAGGMHRDGSLHRRDPTKLERPRGACARPTATSLFDDALQGPQRYNLREQAGDFVIRRVEGIYAYQLACAVDDAFQNITDVVRGSDLLDSTPRQIWLQQCLDLPTPAYGICRWRWMPKAASCPNRSRLHPVDPSNPMPALRQGCWRFWIFPSSAYADTILRRTVVRGAVGV